ncbi:MAG: helix-turn-helix domain-containing protein [Ruminococcus sp.]|nr:helix-turn-helix domain-containing protein [Ruminococcus sp.]
MFKNKNEGKNNYCGKKITELRLQMKPKCSQRQLADKLQLIGIDIDKNAIQRIECGKRFITDIEILAFCKIFGIEPNDIFK